MSCTAQQYVHLITKRAFEIIATQQSIALQVTNNRFNRLPTFQASL